MARRPVSLPPELEEAQIPEHIAIIMDGNGRWAQQRGLPRIQGHFEGRRATKRVIEACHDFGVHAVSVYAFSSENWKRPAEEVHGLMDLIEHALREEIDEMHEDNVVFLASGRLQELPQTLQDAISEGRAKTATNTGLTVNVLVNYGGRAEIADAARKLAEKVRAGEMAAEDIDEQAISDHLYAPHLPDPGLVLRPGGESRISNFLLWELAYSEIIIMPVLWPDFTSAHLVEAILEFSRRQRRFGGVTDTGAAG